MALVESLKVTKPLATQSESEGAEIFFTKQQVRETLQVMINSDKFMDNFYSLLVKKYGKPKQ